MQAKPPPPKKPKNNAPANLEIVSVKNDSWVKSNRNERRNEWEFISEIASETFVNKIVVSVIHTTAKG